MEQNPDLEGRVRTDRTGAHFIHGGLPHEGDLLRYLCQLSSQLFLRLQNLHGEIYICMASTSKSRQPRQQNKLVHTSGMCPSGPVQRVVEKERLHVRGVHSCRVGSLFRPRGKSLRSIISCREAMRRENALTEKKKSAFHMIKAGI